MYVVHFHPDNWPKTVKIRGIKLDYEILINTNTNKLKTEIPKLFSTI